MSQSRSDQPPYPSAGANSPRDDELAAQARAAADQALQLAKLAEESARLARHLNEQVAARQGNPPLDQSIDADGALPVKSEPDTDTAKRRLIRNTQRSGSNGTTPPGPPIRIRTAPRDQRPERAGATLLKRNWNSVLLSTALHMVVLILLGLLTFVIRNDKPIDTIVASFVDEESMVEEDVPIEEPLPEQGEQQKQPLPEEELPKEELPKEEEPPPPEPDPAELPPSEIPARPVPEKMEVAEEPPPPTPGPAPAAAEPPVDLTNIDSRSDAGKAVLLKKYGGTAASESAVSRALDWFVSVQRQDGSWDFNDVGGSSHAGKVNNPMGATSYVLLSFLGAGQTHRTGKYKTNVGRGLSFLLQYGRRVGAGVDLRGPNVESDHNFYVQGAAAMALCEAYMMTKDRRLRIPAQGAIDFIVAAQDPVGGGWRYEPREPGCTSVSTLQLLALVSAQRGGFKVPLNTLKGVEHFYTTVKCDDGPGRYCYQAAEPSYKSASTAQATLGRMYLGAAKNDPDVQAAIALLDDRGPYDNRYYCYYATQVMKNAGGDAWVRWNDSMRDELIRTQVADQGPAFGSWTPLQRGITDQAGGRLFITALSTMTLEVYYRYLPLYDSLSLPQPSPPQATNPANNVAADNSVDPPPTSP